MGRHGIPSFADLWLKHETLYVAVFMMALRRLSETGCDTNHEDRISEKLYLLMRQICREETRRRHCEIPTPAWDEPIPPANETELKGGKSKKRPDFTRNLVNTYASCADDHEIAFHVECKRLGHPTSKSWNLNENYVTEGIKRFDCASHEYGKRAPSGMMLGYIISMSPERILKEVNTHQKKHCPNNPPIAFDGVGEGVQRYGHDLDRKNVLPRKFKLIHLWVDLRKGNGQSTDPGS